MLKILETKKLYYRKFPYKVALRIKGGYYVTRYGSSAVLKAKEWEVKYGSQSMGYRYSRIDMGELEQFTNLALQFIGRDDIRVRAEGTHFNLFSLDKTTHDSIVKTLGPWLEHVSEPKTDKDLQYLLENKSIKVIVDQLPHEKYKYKIVLKSSMKPDVRLRLKDWMGKYSQDDMTISSRTTYDWMKGLKPYAQDPFIYVAEDKVRTMVELYIGTNKARTEEFVLRSSI